MQGNWNFLEDHDLSAAGDPAETKHSCFKVYDFIEIFMSEVVNGR